MTWTQLNPASRRYHWRAAVLILIFTGLVVGIDKILDPSINNWSAGATWPLVGLTCLPLALWGYETVRYVRHLDEMVAQMQVRAAAIAALAVLFFGAVTGVAEIYGQMEPLNTALMLPFAAVVHSAASLWQEWRMR
ncbi:hypothetical protein [Maricaulis sp.]|uniref:hypothetical protein n=1 Tax=Maricaulis sp. TaxID=1486257 RepID=UPI002603B24A|nr:hypothetical protein [Maricaulis sp.]